MMRRDRKVEQLRKRLAKKAKKGNRGGPTATIAFYGPDDRRASKLVVGVFRFEGAEPEMRKWFSETSDVRYDATVLEQVTAFLKEWPGVSVSMVDRIIGCPHEEGIDYEGPVCPECPFWANRDRWTGEVLH